MILYPVSIGRNTADYPDALATYLDGDAPKQLTVWGRSAIFNVKNRSLALFCSGMAPAGILLAVHDMAQTWREKEVTVISGFHSPVEQEALTVLLRQPGCAIICAARSLEKMQLKKEWRGPMKEGRLAIVSGAPAYVHRPTKQTAYERNRLAAALADKVLIAHAQPGSSTWRLAEEVVGWGKEVYTIEHQANRAILRIGARVRKDE